MAEPKPFCQKHIIIKKVCLSHAEQCMSYVLITELRNGLWWSIQISDLGREPACRLCRLAHPLNSRESWHGSLMLQWKRSTSSGDYRVQIWASRQEGLRAGLSCGCPACSGSGRCLGQRSEYLEFQAFL